MEFSCKTVELVKINLADAAFRISSGDASVALVNSINTLGLQSPPALYEKSDHFIIVSGFARVQACIKNSQKIIDARILPASTPLKTCVHIAILENAFQRELNLMEQARAVSLLHKVCTGTEELVAMAQQVGLGLNPNMIVKLSAVNQMEKTLQEGLISGTIALPVALQISAFDEPKDRAEITRLFVELNLSLNRQRALLESIGAIANRDQITIAQLLNEAPLQKVRLDPELDRRLKVMQILKYIKIRRLPTISLFEDNYKSILNKLKIKKGARLIAPPNFEGTTYTLEVDFQNMDELKIMEKEVQRLFQSPHMANILNQIKK